MNQHGDVQAIGGVNEKIEGFFDVCNLLGLTGEQGVIIPQSNKQHLMLRQDVIDAVEQGQFHIYAVSRVEQALALLSTVALGEQDKQGHYPADSFNEAVYQRLQTWADVHKSDKDSAQDEAESD
jgi:predicted ATP-dependent protease